MVIPSGSLPHPVQLMEVVSQEGDGVLRPADTQAHDGILQDLLDVVALHVCLALPQGLLLLGVGRHLYALAGRWREANSSPTKYVAPQEGTSGTTLFIYVFSYLSTHMFTHMFFFLFVNLSINQSIN